MGALEKDSALTQLAYVQVKLIDRHKSAKFTVQFSNVKSRPLVFTLPRLDSGFKKRRMLSQRRYSFGIRGFAVKWDPALIRKSITSRKRPTTHNE